MNICCFGNTWSTHSVPRTLQADSGTDWIEWNRKNMGNRNPLYPIVAKLLLAEFLSSSQRSKCGWLECSLSWCPQPKTVITVRPCWSLLRSLCGWDGTPSSTYPPVPTSIHSQTWGLTEIPISQISLSGLWHWGFRKGPFIYNHFGNPKT